MLKSGWSFSGPSRAYTRFQEFLGLENVILKFDDFPGLYMICTNPMLLVNSSNNSFYDVNRNIIFEVNN